METATITPTQPSQAILDYLESVKSKMTSFQSDVVHDIDTIKARPLHTFIHAWSDNSTIIFPLYEIEKDGDLIEKKPYLFGECSYYDQMHQGIEIMVQYSHFHYAILHPEDVRTCTSHQAISMLSGYLKSCLK